MTESATQRKHRPPPSRHRTDDEGDIRETRRGSLNVGGKKSTGESKAKESRRQSVRSSAEMAVASASAMPEAQTHRGPASVTLSLETLSQTRREESRPSASSSNPAALGNRRVAAATGTSGEIGGRGGVVMKAETTRGRSEPIPRHQRPKSAREGGKGKENSSRVKVAVRVRPILSSEVRVRKMRKGWQMC